MTGVKKVAGEWAQDQVTERGMQITGDIVTEWALKNIFAARKAPMLAPSWAVGTDK